MNSPNFLCKTQSSLVLALRTRNWLSKKLLGESKTEAKKYPSGERLSHGMNFHAKICSSKNSLGAAKKLGPTYVPGKKIRFCLSPRTERSG